jgi:hypothetical protein
MLSVINVIIGSLALVVEVTKVWCFPHEEGYKYENNMSMRVWPKQRRNALPYMHVIIPDKLGCKLSRHGI